MEKYLIFCVGNAIKVGVRLPGTYTLKLDLSCTASFPSITMLLDHLTSNRIIEGNVQEGSDFH